MPLTPQTGEYRSLQTISGASVSEGVAGGGVITDGTGSEALLRISVWAWGKKIKPAMRMMMTTRIGRATQSDS